jgi:4-amino-4-deoxy-L-arabinose transferase-like glycosyltransferase
MASSPLAWILVATLAVHLVGITWGLPGADGWDDDGIAPRDFLSGVYESYVPGSFFTYPPVHLLLLTVLTAPGWIVGLVRATSLAPHDVIAELTRVPYMTAFSFVARVVAEVMAVGIVYAVARIGEDLWGRRAAVWSAGVAALNMSLAYYAHTSNLDVPYLFWAMFALLWFVRAIVRRELRLLRYAGLCAALAVGTKDQAYAVFVLSVPLALGAWLATDAWPRENARALVRQLGLAIGIAAVLLALVDGAVTNPSGFVKRVHFLTGTASQDHAYYAASWVGRQRVLEDVVRFFDRYYPVALGPFVLAGLYLHVARTKGEPGRRVAGLLPALAVVSFTLAFNCVARRTEHRFVLPQSIFVSLYAGLAFDALTAPTSRIRVIGWVAAVAIGGRALFDCVAVDVALVRDPRYAAEAWLDAHVLPGDSIEVYGNNVYLPRFPSGARVQRVDPEPLLGRSPLPGVTEIEQPFDAVEDRKPEWIVASEAWTWRYVILPPNDPKGAIVLAPQQAERERDVATRAYFASLFHGTGEYEMVYQARYDDSFWPRIDIHASTTRTIFVFRRKPKQTASLVGPRPCDKATPCGRQETAATSTRRRRRDRFVRSASCSSTTRRATAARGARCSSS